MMRVHTAVLRLVLLVGAGSIIEGCGAPHVDPADGGTLDAGTRDAGTDSRDGGPILDYYFGNQINGSYLQVFAQGTIAHQERTCCPPQVNDTTEPTLSAEGLSMLNAAITSASDGSQVVTGQPGGGAEGQRYGQLTVQNSSGASINIRELTETKVRANNASSAAWLQDFANGYVQIKMPK